MSVNEFFKPEDFAWGMERRVDERSSIHAGTANYLLQEKGAVLWLHKSNATDPRVNWSISEVRQCYHTHQALLIGIEPLEEKKVTITRDDLERICIKHDIREEDAFLIMEELGL